MTKEEWKDFITCPKEVSDKIIAYYGLDNPEDIYRITQEHTSIMNDTIDPERVAEAIKQYIKD